MNNPAERRHALENLWRERTQIALAQYRIAKDASADAIADQSDAAPPDGTFAFRKALRLENVALAEYQRVLTIFSDLVAHGKMPPDF